MSVAILIAIRDFTYSQYQDDYCLRRLQRCRPREGELICLVYENVCANRMTSRYVV